MHRPNEIVGYLFSRKYELRDVRIYVKIGIYTRYLFTQRDAHIHRELWHPNAHILVNMAMGVRTGVHIYVKIGIRGAHI